MSDRDNTVEKAEVIPAEALQGKYVYCIIRNDRSREFGEIGIGGGARVYTVNHNDLAAVVSDTPIVIYDPTRENVLAHEFVNETVMREFTLIPMSFGTVFRSDNDVMALLKSTYQAFTDVLDKMQDKIEFGLKILWDRDKVVAAIERENDEIRFRREGERDQPAVRGFTHLQVHRAVAPLQFREHQTQAGEGDLRRSGSPWDC
jgi:hypothetical protein